MAATRDASLDAARAIAMMFVLAGHTAVSFMVTPVGWAVQDRSQHLGVDLFLWIVRAFAMPVFFWLSGYFARVIYETGGVRAFARHRVMRILVPLVVALVPCSLALTNLWTLGREVTARPQVAENIPHFTKSEIPLVLGHLWYLYYLLWFSAVALVVVPLARRLRIPAIRGVLAIAIPLAVLIAVFAYLGAVHTDTPMGFVVDVPIACFMGAYFMWGWFVHGSGDLERYARYAWIALAAAPLLLAPVFVTLYRLLDDPTGRAPLYAMAASALFSIAVIIAFVGLCVRYGKRPRRVLTIASESSYWFYVAHVPLVVLLQIALANVEVPGALKYVAIMAITTVACVGTYELLIRRTRARRILG